MIGKEKRPQRAPEDTCADCGAEDPAFRFIGSFGEPICKGCAGQYYEKDLESEDR